jgi:hypothetical protein
MISRALPRRVAIWLAVVIIAGLVVRISLLFLPVANHWDLQSFAIVLDGLHQRPLHVYRLGRWPYPPGFFPWIYVAGVAYHRAGLPFEALIKLPAVLADLALAAVVSWETWRRTQDRSAVLFAAALVALGPSFFLISAFHGQFDSLAILPAVIGVIVWSRGDTGRRALLAGALIGIGGALKTVPLLMVFALLPTARDIKEGLQLAAVAFAIPLLTIVPFVITEPTGTIHSLAYTGIPGWGGISMLAQPGLIQAIFTSTPASFNGASLVVARVMGPLAAVILLMLEVQLLRRRVPAASAATILWLAVYVFAPNFFIQYLIWGMPFFILAGHRTWTALLQLIVLLPSILAEAHPWHTTTAAADAGVIYVVMMAAFWLGLVVATARSGLALLAKNGRNELSPIKHQRT